MNEYEITTTTSYGESTVGVETDHQIEFDEDPCCLVIGGVRLCFESPVTVIAI